jgi:hypothetical protein
VKLVSVEAAQSLMLATPRLTVDDQMGWFEFGVEPHPDDWTCRVCSSMNFHWRLICYKCQQPKSKGKSVPVSRPLVNDGQEDVCLPTVNSRFLLIRSIDPDWDGPQIFDQFMGATESAFVRVWMARDSQTYQSRGFAFAEFETPAVILDAAMYCASSIDYFVDGKGRTRPLPGEDARGLGPFDGP